MSTTLNQEFSDLRPSDLITFARETSQPYITLLMPTHRTGSQMRQDPIRLKNLLTQAEQLLDANGQKIDLLNPVRKKLQDTIFWQHQGKGLAILISADTVRFKRVSHSVTESVQVGSSPRLVSLLPAHGSYQEGFVLTVTWDEARLLQFSDGTVESVENDSFPVTYAELIALPDPEEHIQYSSHRAVGNTASSQTAMYHGHGEGEETIEADRRHYLSRVGERVANEIYNSGLPLIVVGTQEVVGHFTTATSVAVAARVTASPIELTRDELYERSRAALVELSESTQSEFADRFGTAAANGRASTDLAEIATAAMLGRVESLLVNEDACLYAVVDEALTTVTETGSPDDTELVNFSVIKTLKNGGDARRCAAGDLPAGADAAAAIFRF